MCLREITDVNIITYATAVPSIIISTEYLYFVGCNGSFDTRGKKITESVVRTLKDAGIEFSILGNDEGCTGDPARRAGNEYLFDMLATENVETFKEKGVRKVVTHCPH